MTHRTVNIGSVPNDTNADPARTAFGKINSDVTDLYSGVSIGDPRYYGAVPDNSTDATTAIQTAIAAVQGTGVPLVLLGGVYLISGALSVTDQLTVVGGGTTAFGSNGGSGIRTSSATADIFTVNTTRPFSIRDVSLYSNSAKASGNGITITQTGANLNRLSRIERCYILNMAIGVSLNNCANYTVRDNLIQDFWVEGIYHTGTSSAPDLGDSIIEGNTIWDFNVTTGDSCIRLDPGAAVNIIGNKLLSAQYGVRLTVSQGPTGTLNIVGNSIEQQTGISVFIQQTVAGKTYGNVCIANNEFSTIGLSSFQSGINIAQGLSVQYLSNVAITGNVFNMSTTQAQACVSVFDGNGVTITGNVINNNNTSGMTYGIDVGGNITNSLVDDNKVVNPGTGGTYSPNTVLVSMKPSGFMTFSTGTSNVAAGATSYLGAADVHATVGDASFYVPFKCRAVRLFTTAGSAPGAAQTFTYTLMVNGAASAITTVVSGAGTTDGQDITHVVAIPAPDGPTASARIAMQVVASGGAAVVNHRVTVQLVKDD